MSNSFACKNQDFDGPFEILIGHLEKWWAQETLISTLQQNEHQIWIAYVLGPAKNEIRITLSLIAFFHKMVRAHPRNIPAMFSGLDKDLDQWVFHPLLFNLMSILLNI